MLQAYPPPWPKDFGFAPAMQTGLELGPADGQCLGPFGQTDFLQLLAAEPLAPGWKQAPNGVEPKRETCEPWPQASADCSLSPAVI